VSFLQFAASHTSPSSLAAIYRARYPGAPEGPIDLEKQLTTLSFVISTLNKGDIENPFVDFMKATVGNLLPRIRSAQPHELTVYATSIIPGVLDQIEAFTSDTTCSVTKLREDNPMGWYTPHSRLADALDRAVAAAHAQQLASLSQQVQALRPPRSKAGGADPTSGGQGRDPKNTKRKREGAVQGPLSDICSRVITTGKEEPCGRTFCNMQHAFPAGTSDKDKAAAKARIEKLHSDRGHSKKPRA